MLPGVINAKIIKLICFSFSSLLPAVRLVVGDVLVQLSKNSKHSQ